MKKKISLSFIAICISIFALSILNVSAGTYESLTYSVSDGTVRITGCEKSVTEIKIPEEIEGYPVTAIDGYTFYNCTGLTSITIPDSVTSIGNHAFSNCSSLTAAA